MRRSLPTILSLAWLLLLLAGCSSGGGSGGAVSEGGIGGSGITRGLVTQVRSATVAVAGTTYDIDNATLDLDDATAVEVGMKVTVEGTRSGDTGTADTVVYDDDLEGPISAIVDVEFDFDGLPTVSELTILDQTVVIQRDVTVFVDENDPNFDFDSIAMGDLVEISGFRAAPASLEATRLELVAPAATAPAMPDVELKGEVSNPMPGVEFEIGAIQILFDGTTVLEGFDGDPIREGDFVEVEGLLTAPTTVDARNGGRIELEDPAFEGNLDDLQIEGIVSDFVSLGDFLVDGQPVDADGFTVVFEPNTTSFVQNGTFVEVEGELSNGVLVAQKVKQRGGEARVAAEIADAAMDVDAAAGTFVLLRDAQNPDGIEFKVDSSTRFEGDGFEGLSDLVTGDFVEVRGIRVEDTATGLTDFVLATEVELEDEVGDVEVRGSVEQFVQLNRTFTLLGLDIELDDDTVYDDFPVLLPNPEDNFFQYLVAIDPNAVLDVEDETNVADDMDATTLDFADKVELEDD